MKAINSTAVEYLQSLIDPNNKIVKLEVYNKHLRATLRSGIFFSVKNVDIMEQPVIE